MEEKKDGQTRLKLEELFAEIEDILEQMDDKEISLEKSFLLYEEGMKKLKQCNDKIDQVEKKMQVISEQGLEEF
ncbi:MAG: exodeoxyribonuclease VII small subunit [Eubacterium sp.]|nr:exodeoxyribonuclease VII small subunit [Eubacterium sp.]